MLAPMAITAPPRAPERRPTGAYAFQMEQAWPAGILITLAVAAAVFWAAFDNGTYGVVARTGLAVVLWWTIGLLVAAGFLPARLTRAALVTGVLLAAFAAWTGASIAWADSAEKALIELDRVLLYLGVFALAALAGTRATAARWADGIGLATVGIAAAALASRFFPGPFPPLDSPRFLSEALSYPLNYANGLAIFVALGVPLLLRAASAPDHPVIRGLWLAPLPATAAVVYFASSRGAALVTVVGALAFVALTDRRWAAGGAAFVGAGGSALVVAFLVRRPELADAPLETTTTGRRVAALFVIAGCLLAGGAYAAACHGLRGYRPRRRAGAVAVAACALAALVVLVAADPVERARAFRQPPDATTAPATTSADLVSTGSTGRWQHWQASVDQFREDRLKGDGAGSYEAWWAEHGSFALFVRDAHSLYFETLGELGIVGLVLLLAAIGSGLVALVLRLLRDRGPDRSATAALGAVFVAFALAVGFDWMWEMTAVSIVGFLALGLLVAGHGDGRPRRGPPWRGRAVRAAVGVAAFCLVLPQAVVLLGQLSLGESQAAVTRGDGAAALEAARDARAVQPWAASPYVQLALVTEQLGELEAAHGAVLEAIERDPRDWRSWLIRTRLEAQLGLVAEARQSLRRLKELNPRSGLVVGLAPG
jgi:O-Antigen ligase